MSNFSNRINDAYQSAKNLEKLLDEKEHTELILEKSGKLLEEIRNGVEPDLEVFKLLDINVKGYALRLKLRGIIRVNQNKLHEINSAIKQEYDILNGITVCPYCAGSGEVIDHSYERFGRKIHATTSTSECKKCNGTGRVKLGESTEKMVQYILQRYYSSRL